MELEKLIIANKVRDKLEKYTESIQHLNELIEFTNKGAILNIAIKTCDGWGAQRINVPQEAFQDALPVIRESLVKNVKKLEQQFKEL